MSQAIEQRPKWTRLPVARAALRRWSGFSGAKLRHITFGENTTWKIVNKKGAFALRIYRPGRWTDEQISVEHSLMSALGKDYGVYAPCYGVDNETLQLVPGTNLRAALYPWVPGRLFLKQPKAKRVRLLGHYIASLHNHLARKSLRDDIRSWDIASLIEQPMAVAKNQWTKELPGTPFPVELATWANECQQAWKKLAPKSNLLHADLHMGNIKWSQQGLSCIDFDDCGWAPLPYDLAVCAQGCWGMREPRVIEEMVKAYNEFAKDKTTIEAVKLFIVIRNFWSLGWVSERPELYKAGELGKTLQRIANTIDVLVKRQWLVK